MRQALAEAAVIRAQAAELRTSLENPQTPLSFPAEWLIEAWGGGATDSGIRVSEMTALQVSTVFACVQLISNAIAGLDLNVYERFEAANKRVGRRLADEHYLFDLLQTEPNHEMTSFTFRKSLMCHALLWGNMYAEIERDGAGRAIGLWPRNPAKTRPHRVLRTGLLVYKTNEGVDDVSSPNETSTDGQERTIFAENMLHVPGMAIDGRLGQSVAWLSRQLIGMALATEKFGAKFFANSARPGGVLTHPGKLQPVARANVKQSWQESQGGENAHKVALLEEGIKFEKIAVNAEEAQFIGSREQIQLFICSIFSVPPHMIGDAGKAGGKNNLEQIGGEFVTFALSPWLKALTQEMERKLFPKLGQNAKRFFPHFDTRPLIMPDASSRKDFYGTGKQWGFLNTDDILELEGLNPTEQPGSDKYWMPVNVGVMTAEGAQIPTSPDASNADDVDDPNAPKPKTKDKKP